MRRHGARSARLDADDRAPPSDRRQEIALFRRIPRQPLREKPKLARRERFVAALKELQERLGDLNDAEAAQAITARLAQGPRGNAERLRRRAAAAEAIAAAEEALRAASEAAGYWA